MPGASTSSGTSNNSTTPTQIGQLNTGFNAATGALSQAQAAAPGTTPQGFTASMTPQQLAAYQSVYGGANGNTTGQTQEGVGNLAGTAGAAGLQGALSGYAGYNPSIQGEVNAGNTYAANQDIPGQVRAAMLGANQEANQVTLPGIDSSAAGTGNTNSSRTGVAQGIVQGDLAQQAGALTSSLTANAENTGAQLQNNNNSNILGALSGQASAGVGGINAGSGASSGGVLSQANLGNQLLTGASGEQQNQQDQFTNQNQAFNFSQTSPFTALQQYMNALNVNAGGTSSGSTTATPSFMQTVGSLLGAGGSAIGTSGTASGAGASGLLGMFSDRRMKKDIMLVGELFDGTPVYRYRYTWGSPMQIGVMAQDIERHVPEAVSEVGGYKMVDYEKATQRSVGLSGGH